MKKEIVITIAEDGTTRVEGFGFEGLACDRSMKQIEEALGFTGKKIYNEEAHRKEGKLAKH